MFKLMARNNIGGVRGKICGLRWRISWIIRLL